MEGGQRWGIDGQPLPSEGCGFWSGIGCFGSETGLLDNFLPLWGVIYTQKQKCKHFI